MEFRIRFYFKCVLIDWLANGSVHLKSVIVFISLLCLWSTGASETEAHMFGPTAQTGRAKGGHPPARWAYRGRTQKRNWMRLHYSKDWCTLKYNYREFQTIWNYFRTDEIENVRHSIYAPPLQSSRFPPSCVLSHRFVFSVLNLCSFFPASALLNTFATTPGEPEKSGKARYPHEGSVWPAGNRKLEGQKDCGRTV